MSYRVAGEAALHWYKENLMWTVPSPSDKSRIVQILEFWGWKSHTAKQAVAHTKPLPT